MGRPPVLDRGDKISVFEDWVKQVSERCCQGPSRTTAGSRDGRVCLYRTVVHPARERFISKGFTGIVAVPRLMPDTPSLKEASHFLLVGIGCQTPSCPIGFTLTGECSVAHP